MYQNLSIAYICLLLGFSRQAYYAHNQRQEDSSAEQAIILGLVKEIRADHPKMGTEKLHFLLQDDFKEHGIKCGRDKLNDLLREHGMLIRKRKSRPRTTNSNHPYKIHENLIKDMTLSCANKLWVSDITYIRTKLGFAYLSLITDAYSRKIVGWCLWPDYSRQGPINALKMAIETEKPSRRTLTHHSDRGIQYCCHDYVNYLKSESIAISMTQNGDPYENAIAERVNGILKGEYSLNQTFEDYYQANEVVKQAVNLYNNKRPHSSCDYMFPIQAHDFTGELPKRWKSNKSTNFDAQK